MAEIFRQPVKLPADFCDNVKTMYTANNCGTYCRYMWKITTPYPSTVFLFPLTPKCLLCYSRPSTSKYIKFVKLGVEI